MNVRKSLLVGGLASVSLVVPLLVSAAASPAAASCSSANLNTGLQKQGGSVTKPSGTTCNDLNLTKAHDGAGDGFDSYAGFLFHSSTGTWQACSSGYHDELDFTASSSSQWVVLCTNVSVGTKMSVGSRFDAPDQVRIAS